MRTPDSSAPTERTSNDPLPFAALLELLRMRGVPIGLDEYLAVGRLISRFNSVSIPQLRGSLACLLGRDALEQAVVQQAFDDLYGEAAGGATTASAESRRVDTVPRSSAIPVPPRFPWWLFAGTALVIALAATVVTLWIEPPPLAATISSVEMPSAGTQAPPQVPAPPASMDRSAALQAAIAAAAAWGILVVTVSSWWWRRNWLRRIHRAQLSSFSSPFHYRWPVHSSATVAHSAVEDFAAALGRAFSRAARSDDLDIDETLRATLAAGLYPTIFFKSSVRPISILLLQDRAADMRFWNGRVNHLVNTLSREGIAIDRWSFDGDPGIVYRTRGDDVFDAVPLASVAGHADAEVLLVISTGRGVRSGSASTVQGLNIAERWPRHLWLNPIRQPAEWPEHVRSLRLNMLPLTRDGLEAAASAILSGRTPPVETIHDVPRRVTASDILRIKRLAALSPRPTVDVIESLRQRFCKDVPEEVMLHVFPADMTTTDVVPLTQSEAAAYLAAESREFPSRTKQVRGALLELLERSKPSIHSAAHLRWELDVSSLRVQEADDPSVVRGAAISLRRLASTPIAYEVQAAVDRLSRAGTLSRHAGALFRPLLLLEGLRGPRVLPARAAAWHSVGQSWFVLGAALVALVIAAATGGSLIALGFTAVVPREHLENAYRLYHLAEDAGIGQLRVERADTSPEVPRLVQLYRDTNVMGVEQNVDSATWTLTPQDAGHYYQIRGRMSDGRLALSNWIHLSAGGAISAGRRDIIDAGETQIMLQGRQTHACPIGYAMGGINFGGDQNTFMCRYVGATVDETTAATQRAGMLACEEGFFLTAMNIENGLLRCSRTNAGVSTASLVNGNTDPQVTECPGADEQQAGVMVGYHKERKVMLCATVKRPN